MAYDPGDNWGVIVGGEFLGPFTFDQSTQLTPGTYTFLFYSSGKYLVTESKDVTIPSGVSTYVVDVEYHEGVPS
jgi:hypothetical protein